MFKEKGFCVWVALIFLAAFFSRFAFLGYSTLIHTEAENGLNAGWALSTYKALPVLAGLNELRQTFLHNNNPVMQGILFNTPIAALFGLNAFSIRLNAALGGVISLMIAYILIRRHADRLTALFALILLAFNPFLITFNRFGHLDSLQAAFILGGILFLDIFVSGQKQNILFFLFSSLLFSIAFLIKYNAAGIVLLVLFLYRLFFGLKFKHIFFILFLVTLFSGLLFFDEMDKLFNSMLLSLRYVRINFGQDISHIIADRLKGTSRDIWALMRGCAFYFEQTALPVFASLFFLKRTGNKLFKFMLLFSILYFGLLLFQGRVFYRYFQMGVFTASIAFAFILRIFAEKKYSYRGMLFLSAFVLWSLASHASYILSQYRHVPYEEIARIAKESLKKGNSIILFGRTADTDFYFSPEAPIPDAGTKQYISGAVSDPMYPEPISYIKKAQPKLELLFDPDIVNSGDTIVVAAEQMDQGEPIPRSLWTDMRGVRLWGIRRYGHRLENVANFYDAYKRDARLQEKYILLAKIPLTNSSQELAALILKRR